MRWNGNAIATGERLRSTFLNSHNYPELTFLLAEDRQIAIHYPVPLESQEEPWRGTDMKQETFETIWVLIQLAMYPAIFIAVYKLTGDIDAPGIFFGGMITGVLMSKLHSL